MEVAHPRRILILASVSADLAPVINALVPSPTKAAASSTENSNGGSAKKGSEDEDSVDADDRVESSKEWCEEWKQQDGASEVVRAVGAWIIAFAKPASQDEENTTKQFISHVSEVISHHSGPDYGYSEEIGDAVRLAVALPAQVASSHGFDIQAWDDACQESGAWELVDAEASGARNQYGGFKRLLQALQSAEWDAGDEDLEAMLGLDDEEEDGSDPGEPETEEMREPILSAEKEAKASEDGQDQRAEEKGSEEDVEELQRMMVRLQAAKDMGADLPIGERRKLAARAVRDVMRG